MKATAHNVEADLAERVAALEASGAVTMALLRVMSARLAAVDGHTEPMAPDAVTT
jgi:hypothetical protein